MVYIYGVSFVDRQLVQKALTSFFGIGSNVSSRMMARLHIHNTAKVADLNNRQVLDVNAALSEMRIENDLRRSVWNDIARLKETGTYRGRRHALGLPARGQNTRSQIKNAIRLNRLDRKLGRTH